MCWSESPESHMRDADGRGRYTVGRRCNGEQMFLTQMYLNYLWSWYMLKRHFMRGGFYTVKCSTVITVV